MTMFVSSFAVIVLMIVSKIAEKRIGTIALWTSFVEKSDERIHAFLLSVSKKYKLWKKIAYLFFFEFLPAYMYELLVKMKDYVQRRYYESQTRLQGNKKMLRSSGSVSSFLQEISTHTDDVVAEQPVEVEQTQEKKEEGELKNEQ